MVGPDQEGMLDSLQPVTPLLQGHLDSQQLPVPHIIISFSGGEFFREERTGMELVIRHRSLG